MPGETPLEKLVSAGLNKCMLKLSAAAHGAWRLESVRWRGGWQQEDPPAGGREAVRVTVGHPAPLATILLFEGREAEHLCRCFVHDDLAAALGPGSQQVTLLELGNIVLNAVINSLLKALKNTAIPSVPEYSKDGPDTCRPAPGAKPPHIRISAFLSASRDGKTAGLEAAAVLPASLSAGL